MVPVFPLVTPPPVMVIVNWSLGATRPTMFFCTAKRAVVGAAAEVGQCAGEPRLRAEVGGGARVRVDPVEHPRGRLRVQVGVWREGDTCVDLGRARRDGGECREGKRASAGCRHRSGHGEQRGRGRRRTGEQGHVPRVVEGEVAVGVREAGGPGDGAGGRGDARRGVEGEEMERVTCRVPSPVVVVAVGRVDATRDDRARAARSPARVVGVAARGDVRDVNRGVAPRQRVVCREHREPVGGDSHGVDEGAAPADARGDSPCVGQRCVVERVEVAALG